MTALCPISRKQPKVQSIAEIYFIDAFKNFSKFVDRDLQNQYPYVQVTKNFWLVICKSYIKTARVNGHINTIFSERFLTDVALGLITTTFLVQMFIMTQIFKCMKGSNNSGVFCLGIIDSKDSERVAKIMTDFNAKTEYSTENRGVFSIKGHTMFTRLLCTIAKHDVILNIIGHADLVLTELKIMVMTKIDVPPMFTTHCNKVLNWSFGSETIYVYNVKCNNVLEFIKEANKNQLYISHIICD